MIDLRLLREDPDRVRGSQRARGDDEGLVDRVLRADDERRAAVARFESLRAEQKTLGRAVAQARGEEKDALLGRTAVLAQQVKDADAARAAADGALREAWLALPNLVEDGTPPGGEDDAVVLEEVGPPPAFDFLPRDHLALGELLGALDVERAAKVSGARFYYLTGVGALLELALVNLAVAQATAAGFTPVIPPVLVRPEAMEGTGFLGQAAADVYRLPDDDLYLVGTSEVPLAAYHMDETLPADSLPRRYLGLSSCFRREAGSYGKDTRGIIRVHQFDKVEMFVFCAPEAAYDEHRRLLAQEKEFLTRLEVPFRVVDVAAGDLGLSAARKFDCEAWVPTQGRYREVTSTSNCSDFQARRLGVRTRGADGTRPLATLNGTLVAIPRTVVALLENRQRADGSVRVPEALRPFLAPFLAGGDVLEPVRRPG
ncbi:MAG TPA: serine--tRNA ligase [Mycobacteriales bacterium]|nr:serine--tRNA ligase [Mycobacteriales bacterium]